MSELDKDHYAPDSLRRFFGMLLHEYPSGKIREMAFEALHGPPPDLSGQDEQVVARLAWDAERWESELVVPKARAEAAEAQLRELREGYYEASRTKRAMEDAAEELRAFLKAFDEAKDNPIEPAIESGIATLARMRDAGEIDQEQHDAARLAHVEAVFGKDAEES